MVLFKRKVVPPIPKQTFSDEEQEVWLLEASGEIFASYEAYLARVDFFRLKKFICEVSGHSNMTYWEALKSERRAARGVDETFPESLKEPVLRRIQFSTVSRLDHLVEQIYDQFKTDYYPGENVTATIDGYRANALIREKSKVGSRFKDGVLIPGYVRYRIELRSTRKGALAREQYVDSDIINRDRNYFNKALIRAFIKNSCSREAWTGAPWLVKERYAKKFRIDMTIPDHLRQKEKVKVVEEKIDRRFKKRLLENDIKYPIDDLDERLAFDGASRPRLNEEDGIESGFLGDVMSTWTFLNVFGGPLHLDTFIIDDYIDALRYQEIDYPCELMVEIHCALLKALVSEEEPECLVPLPTSHHSSKPTKNGTYSLESKLEAMEIVKTEDDSVSEQGTITTSTSASDNSLLSALQEFRATATKTGNQSWQDWRVRIQTREFLAGGWEYALIGLLDELGDSPRLTPVVLDILDHLLPDGEKHTRKSARENYPRMDAKFKCKAISLLVQLVCQTPMVREFIEESMGQMTELRKEKVEVQRERKVRIEELATLEAELQPFTPEAQSPEDQEEDSDATEDMSEIVVQKRSVKASLKRKREQEAAAAEEAAALAKRTKEYAKRVKAVDAKRDEITACEDRVVNYDHELRERDCQRLRLIGKDRFFNRYWVLEGNGLSQSEIRGEAPFISARLWIQGPSVEDATFFLGGAGVDLSEFPYGRVSAVDTSIVPEDGNLRDRVLSRKEREEGQSVLYDECQWGYYDDQESVEGLIAWLNPKGVREAKLRQTLIARKDEIYKLMEARDKYMHPDSQPVEVVRRSTRITSAHVPEHRFLKWHNTAGEKKRGGRRGGA